MSGPESGRNRRVEPDKQLSVPSSTGVVGRRQRRARRASRNAEKKPKRKERGILGSLFFGLLQGSVNVANRIDDTRYIATAPTDTLVKASRRRGVGMWLSLLGFAVSVGSIVGTRHGMESRHRIISAVFDIIGIPLLLFFGVLALWTFVTFFRLLLRR